MNTRKNLLVLAASLLLVSCGGNTPSSVPSNPSSEPSAPSVPSSDPSVPSSDEGCPTEIIDPNNYSATVYYPSGELVTDSNIRAQWCSAEGACYTPVAIGCDGSAQIELDDGDYILHLNKVPDGYTYNPNINKPTALSKHCDINLKKVARLSGSGTIEDPYAIRAGAVYEPSFASGEESKYFYFTPTESGVYRFESWAVAELATNPINPSLKDWGGNAKNYMPPLPLGEDDNSGEGNNFKYDFEVPDDAFYNDATTGARVCGYTFVYEIAATANTYPASFPVTLTRTGDYVAPVIERTMVEVQSTLTKAEDPAEGMSFTRGKLLEGDDVAVYNEEDDRYHLNSKDGDLIYARLAKPLEFFDNPITWFGNGGSNPFLSADLTKDYTEFVATYARYCNEDGSIPVNAELQGFLDMLQQTQGYFFGEDGYVRSQIESYVEGNEWLFACGYYHAADGTEDNPLIIEEAEPIIASIPENGRIYYNLKIASAVGATLTSTNAGAVLIAEDGTEYGLEGNGFEYYIELGSGYGKFSLRFLDGHAGNIGLRIVADYGVVE